MPCLASHNAWLWPFMAIATAAIVSFHQAEHLAETLCLLASFIRNRAFATLSTSIAVLFFQELSV